MASLSSVVQSGNQTPSTGSGTKSFSWASGDQMVRGSERARSGTRAATVGPGRVDVDAGGAPEVDGGAPVVVEATGGVVVVVSTAGPAVVVGCPAGSCVVVGGGVVDTDDCEEGG